MCGFFRRAVRLLLEMGAPFNWLPDSFGKRPIFQCSLPVLADYHPNGDDFQFGTTIALVRAALMKIARLSLLTVLAGVVNCIFLYFAIGLTDTALRTGEHPSPCSIREIEQQKIPRALHARIDNAQVILRQWAIKHDAHGSTIDIYLLLGSQQAVIDQGRSARVVAVLRNVADESAIEPYLDNTSWSGRLDQWTSIPIEARTALKQIFPAWNADQCVLLRMNDKHSVWLMPALSWFACLTSTLLTVALGWLLVTHIRRSGTGLRKLLDQHALAANQFPLAAELASVQSTTGMQRFCANGVFDIPVSSIKGKGFWARKWTVTMFAVLNISLTGVAIAVLYTGACRREFAFALLGVALLGQYVVHQYLVRRYVPLVQVRIPRLMCGYRWRVWHQMAMRQLADWEFEYLGEYSQFHGACPVVRSLLVGRGQNVLVEAGTVNDSDFVSVLSLFENGMVLESTSLAMQDRAAQNGVPLYIQSVPHGSLLEVLEKHAQSILRIEESLNTGLARIDRQNYQQTLQYAVDLARIDLAKQGLGSNAPPDLCELIGQDSQGSQFVQAR